MCPGDRLVLHVEKAVAGGRMLARHDGAVTLVAAAIPGETVEAEVEKIQRGTIWATTSRVLEASPDRVEPFCDWSCGGSAYVHVAYPRQLALKRDVVRDAFARIAHHALADDLPVAASPVDGYRMRARVHRRGTRVGFFREGTHDLCEAAATRQLLPATIDTLSRLAAALDRTSRVTVTEIEIAENCEATERACHLELAADSDPSELSALTTIDGLTGVSSGSPHNSRTLTLWGSPVVTDDLHLAEPGPRVRLMRHARSFFQGNRYLLADLVRRVLSAVPPGPVLDLYAGVGLFSVAVAARGGGEVTAVEGDSVAAADLKHNAAALTGIVARHQPVEAFLAARRSGRVGTVIVDPPRSGLTRDALLGVAALRPPRLVYVSCDVATLARDARLLMDRGYDLASIEAFDLFPNTAHVETLAVFQHPG